MLLVVPNDSEKKITRLRAGLLVIGLDHRIIIDSAGPIIRTRALTTRFNIHRNFLIVRFWISCRFTPYFHL